MWSIKFLSGPEKGKEYLLPKGLIVLGRGSSCQIPLSVGGISKKHAQITVDENGLLLKDLNSRNGVFLNGAQIQEESLKEGDRVGLYNIIFEIRKKTQKKPFNLPHQIQNQFISQQTDNDLSQESEADPNKLFSSLQKTIKAYLNRVVLPGVYKLAEWMDFRWVVGLFILSFVIVVTLLSSFPLISILKSSIEQESKNHAESIAKTLVRLNRKNFEKGFHTSLNVDFARSRPGVKKAFIINAVNGRILAPAESAELFPKEPFIHQARKLDRSSVKKLDSSTVGAVVPMSFYNPQTGEQAPAAYAVVLYDMGALSVGSSKTLSLLFQNLFIASVLGFFVFFFLVNLIHFPLHSINSQLSHSLKDDAAPAVSMNYQSEILSELCHNINSALNRISINQNSQNNESGGGIEQHRQNEMTNIVEVIGFPALSVNLTDNTIASLNSSFKDQLGLEEILYQPLDSLTDSAFRENLTGLISQGQMNPEDISFGEVSLKGMELQTTCQFIRGLDKPAYAIITFISNEETG